MTFSPLPTGVVSSPDVMGLARRSDGSLWAALADSSLYVAGPGSQTLRPLANLPTSVPTRSQVVDVAAAGSDVFILRAGGALRCTGTCASFTDFTSAGNVGSLETAVALCAREQRVFFISQTNGTTALWELQAGTFVKTVSDLGVGTAESCYVSPANEVMVAGDTVAIVGSTGGLANENFNLNGHPGASWRAITSADAGTFAVGGGSGYRFARREGASWSDLPPDTTGALMGTAISAGSDVYTGGYTNSGSTSTPAIYKWNGSGFVPIVPQPYAIDVTAALEVSATELYFAGSSRSGGTYEVLHGTR
jgi:hypothetical protein